VRVFFETFLKEAHDRALGAADRSVQQDNAPLGPVVARGRLKDVHKMREALIDSVNRVTPVVRVIPEEAIAGDLLLVLDMLFHAVRQNHVVDPLERVPRCPRIFLNELKIVLE
jgi:hypothetical protein